jgi:membrane protein required for beta-lactamase induction
VSATGERRSHQDRRLQFWKGCCSKPRSDSGQRMSRSLEQITKFAKEELLAADRERIVRKSLRFFLACLFYLLPSSALLA